MDTTNGTPAITLEMSCIERWNVFRRLNELAIPCECACGEPLRVTVDTPAAALQVWSVTQQFLAPRKMQIQRLEHCLQQHKSYSTGKERQIRSQQS